MSHGHSRPKCLIISSTGLTSCCRPTLPPSPTPPASATWPVVLQENRTRPFAWRRPDVSRSRCRKWPRQRQLAYASQRLIAFSFSAALLSKIAVKKKEGKKSVLFVVVFFSFPVQACTRLLWSAHGKFFPLYLVLLLYCISIYPTSPPLPSHLPPLCFAFHSSPRLLCLFVLFNRQTNVQ